MTGGDTHHFRDFTTEELLLTQMGKNALFEHTKICNSQVDLSTAEMLSSCNILYLVFEIHASFEFLETQVT